MSTINNFLNLAQRAYRQYTQLTSSKGSGKTQQSKPSPRSSAQQLSTKGGYPGDYRGEIDFLYSPSLDGDADPGEIIWTWVPYEEDHTQGKDRPVILVGRDGEYFLALMLTSKDHSNTVVTDSNYLDIGSGSWDRQGRSSEVKLNRVIRVRSENMRREGAIMPRETFQKIERAYKNR